MGGGGASTTGGSAVLGGSRVVVVPGSSKLRSCGFPIALVSWDCAAAPVLVSESANSPAAAIRLPDAIGG